MSKDFFEQLSNMGKNTMSPMVNLSKVISKSMERAARQQIGAASEIYSSAVKHQQELFGCKKMEDALSLQANFASASASKIVDYTQQTLDTMIETSTEYTKWFEEGAKAMTEEAKTKK